MSGAARRIARRRGTAGFTLIEALIATALMAAILSAIAMVTAQWLPNWNRGFANVQRSELLALGLERLAADISAAEFIPAGRDNPLPFFDGTAMSLAFVRGALGPNTRSGLEIVRIAEIAGEFGPVLVRERAPYVPAERAAPEIRRSGRARAPALSRDIRLCRNGAGVARQLARCIDIAEGRACAASRWRDGPDPAGLHRCRHSRRTSAGLPAGRGARRLPQTRPAAGPHRPDAARGHAARRTMRSPDAARAIRRTGSRGFIVVAVLWILGALATLATIYAVYVVNTSAALGMRDERVRAEALVTAALELTVHRLAAVPNTRPSSGRFSFRVENAGVTVEFRSEAARIDLNSAPKELLAGLFASLGAQRNAAEAYADRIIGWRNPVAPPAQDNESSAYRTAGLLYGPRLGPFPHTGELSLVLGLPEVLVERALPFVTVYSAQPQINLFDSAPEVIAALPGMTPDRLYRVLADRGAARQNAAEAIAALGLPQALVTTQGSKALRVSVRIDFATGRRMFSEVVILPRDSGVEPYSVLSWRDLLDEAAEQQRPAEVR